MAARLRSLALLLLSLAISCEAGSFVFLHYVKRSQWAPQYVQSSGSLGLGWITERDAWGAWHEPNRNDRKEGRCFSVALHSNSFGARDRERTVDGYPHRTVVLGDSFAEGRGVEARERLSDLLEARYHREYLNLGVWSAVGPLSYQILYERLASKFAHDRVLIMFLPDNDFTDNDPDYWRSFRPDFRERYRPYYTLVKPDDYQAFYPVSQPPDGFPNWYSVPTAGWAAWAADWPRRNLWSLTMYRYLRVRLTGLSIYSGYLDYTVDQLKAGLWSFARIKALAGDRQVTILVIPRPQDFERVGASGDRRLIEALDLVGSQQALPIVGLMQWMPKIEPRIDGYFLPCDGHWSAAGNRVAADALSLTGRLGP